MTRPTSIPVIDLFAGPGGLGEGFSSIVNGRGDRHFDVKVSVEKDEIAHKTLSLRALFRAFRTSAVPDSAVPDCDYDYVRGDTAFAVLRGWRKATNRESFGGQFNEHEIALDDAVPEFLQNRLHDSWLRDGLRREKRSHLRSDRHRSMVGPCAPATQKYSPKLTRAPQ